MPLSHLLIPEHHGVCMRKNRCSAGIWKQVYGDDGKVKDIYFYRQMSSDEQHTKVCIQTWAWA